MRRGVLLVVIVSAALASVAAGNDRVASFAVLEQSLLNARQLDFDCEIESRGAVVSNLSGHVHIGTDNVVDVVVSGTFDGKQVNLGLLSDGIHMRGGSNRESFDDKVPSALSEALVVGFVRLGMLHNLALLAVGKPPDHADGGAKEWAVLENMRLGDRNLVDGQRAWPVVGDVFVSGRSSGTATLWIAEETGLPIQRTQRVDFGPDQVMNVLEQYRNVLVEYRRPGEIVALRRVALGQRDLDGVLSAYGPQVRVFEHPSTLRFDGRDALRVFLEQRIESGDRLRAEVVGEAGSYVVELEHDLNHPDAPAIFRLYQVERSLIVNEWLVD